MYNKINNTKIRKWNHIRFNTYAADVKDLKLDLNLTCLRARWASMTTGPCFVQHMLSTVPIKFLHFSLEAWWNCKKLSKYKTVVVWLCANYKFLKPNYQILTCSHEGKRKLTKARNSRRSTSLNFHLRTQLPIQSNMISEFPWPWVNYETRKPGGYLNYRIEIFYPA